MIAIRNILLQTESLIVKLSTKERILYSESSIRDAFIQMPTRTITYENWNGIKKNIIRSFGDTEYRIAFSNLLKKGWLIKEDKYLKWKSYYNKQNL